MKIAFIHIPKTAGTSLSTLLLHIFGATNEVCFEHLGEIGCFVGQNGAAALASKHLVRGHFRLSEIRQFLHMDASEWRVITTIRNPIERAISFFLFLRRVPQAIPHVSAATEGKDFAYFFDYMYDHGEHHFRNGQVWQLDAATWQAALDNVRSNFWLCADCTRLQDMVAAIACATGHRELQNQPVPCENAAPVAIAPEDIERGARPNDFLSSVSADTRRRIERVNAEDFGLWDALRIQHGGFFERKTAGWSIADAELPRTDTGLAPGLVGVACNASTDAQPGARGAISTSRLAKGRLALVTGAGGFIASHLVEELVRTGWHVRCLLRYGSAGSLGCLAELPETVLENLDIRRGDLLDGEFVTQCCAGVDTVFNLAARISIPYSYAAPRDTFHVNALGTLNIAEAVRRTGVRRLIQVSTSEVFGSALRVPMGEDHRLKAQSPYAASKIAADKIIESYVCSFDLPAVIVRPFNTFGPRQSPRAVIATIIDQALRGGPIRLGSLWPRRDFTYVGDTVRGLLRAAAAESALGGEFNLGTGRDVSIGGLAEMVLAIIGTPCEIVADQQRERPEASEVDRLLADNGRARRVLGWEPEVSLESGLHRTVEWWRARVSPVAFHEQPI